MKIKCVIIDDEPLAIKVVKSYCQEIPYLEILGEFDNPISALQTLENEEVDVLFLDINMPKMNGLAFIKSLQIKPLIIVTTAYREHAVESYELDVLDYLVKPIPFNRFLKAVNKISQELGKKKETSEPVSGNSPKDSHIFLKVDKKLVKIFLSEILFIESLKDYIKVHTLTGNYIVHKSLSSISDELPSSNFIRVHKSFAIAIDKVKTVEGNLIEIENKKIPIGRNYIKYAKERIFSSQS